jgi:hypothetical protein
VSVAWTALAAPPPAGPARRRAAGGVAQVIRQELSIEAAKRYEADDPPVTAGDIQPVGTFLLEPDLLVRHGLRLDDIRAGRVLEYACRTVSPACWARRRQRAGPLWRW